MTVTYHLFMFAYVLFSALFVFTAHEMGYDILSTISGIAFVVSILAVEVYSEKTIKKSSDVN